MVYYMPKRVWNFVQNSGNPLRLQRVYTDSKGKEFIKLFNQRVDLDTIERVGLRQYVENLIMTK